MLIGTYEALGTSVQTMLIETDEALGGLLGVCPTLTNLGNDHEFISKGIHLHRYEAFWGSPNQRLESLCSKWTISYHCEDP